MTESIRIPKEDSINDPRRSNVVARIDGVRPCLHCGHDLHGQPIRREESLGLLVTFCPECAQAASLVDYPSLGIWGRRLGVLSLICMIIMVLVFLVVSVMSLFGIIMGLTSELYGPAQSAMNSMIDGGWQVERSWWEANAAKARATMWSSVNYRDPDFVGIGLLFLPICFIIGVIWSGILLGLRRRYLPLVGIAICVLGWLCIWPVLITDGNYNTSNQISAYRLARRELVPMLSFLVMTGLSIPLMLGLSFGRPILRSLVKVVLPPGSRGMLRPLWEIDGIQVPLHRD